MIHSFSCKAGRQNCFEEVTSGALRGDNKVRHLLC